MTTSQVPNIWVEKYKKRSNPGPFPKHWLVFSYICSEYYEWNINIDEKGIKIKPGNFPKSNPFIITFQSLQKNGFQK